MKFPFQSAVQAALRPRPATGRRDAAGRERWLLLYNCQGVGLANSLNLLCPLIDVEFLDPAAVKRQGGALVARLGDYDRVLVAPQLEASLGLPLADARQLWRVPTIHFDAYHPDICYLVRDGRPCKGPMGDYHSLIAYAAFRNGLDATRTLALFDAATYAALGYLDRWAGARARLLETFGAAGFDLAAYWSQWSRHGAFMYSLNHVRIHCIRDVALAILARAGLAAMATDLMPHDNLTNGAIYPVYPEIAAPLGVAGSYHFKPAGQYRLMGLEQFVHESFALYREAGDIEIRAGSVNALAAARHALEAIA